MNIWLYLFLATVGFGLGLRLRGQAIATVSVIVMIAVAGSALYARQTVLGLLGETGLALVCLQVGFLIGAAISAR